MRTAFDRYLELSDQAVDDETAFEEAMSLFAEDATVDLRGEPVRGIQAIRALYRQHLAGLAVSHHLWRIIRADANTATAKWGSVGKTPDGDVITAGGTEVVQFDHDGRIAALVNTPG